MTEKSGILPDYQYTLGDRQVGVLRYNATRLGRGKPKSLREILEDLTVLDDYKKEDYR